MSPPNRNEFLKRAGLAERALELVFAGLAGIYALFAILNWLRLPSPEKLQVVGANVCLALVFGGAFVFVQRRRLAPGPWGESALTAAFVLAHTNTLNTLRLLDQPLSLVFVTLALVGFASFTASDRWFAFGISFMVVEWVAVKLLVRTSPSRLLDEAFFCTGGVVVAMVVYLTRRAGLVRLGRALLQSESDRRRLESVLNGAHDLIQSVDATGRIRFVNHAWSQAMGIPAAEAAGRSLLNLTHHDDRDLVRRMLASPETAELQLTLVSATGDPIALEGRLEPVLDRAGTLESTRGYFRDTTVERALRADLGRQEELLRQFAAATHQVFWIYDLDSKRFLFVNQAFEELSGYRPDELVARPSLFFELFRGEDLDEIRGFVRRASAGEVLSADHVLVRQDGGERWVRLHVYPLSDDRGRVDRIAGVSEDVTERKRLELELRQSELELRARERILGQFVESTPAAVAMFDGEMRFLAASDRWRSDYHLGDRPLLGESLYTVLPELGEEWRAVHRTCLAGEGGRADEVAFTWADGTLDWLRWEIQPWTTGDGEVGGVLLFTEVITETKRARDALEQRARIDHLTGTLNRAALHHDLQRLWGRYRETATGFAVLYLDLDQFKAVNDEHGHGAGDDVLVEVASRLREGSRPGDLVARIGGDEFVVVAHEVADQEVGELLAHRLATLVERPISTRIGPVRVGASVGLAMAHTAASVEQLIERADRAMYDRKHPRTG